MVILSHPFATIGQTLQNDLTAWESVAGVTRV